mmetsp:Transcript_72069/g.185913  ORF Transcript_72069/g.185913 Transcript_72069/m.185913 type:complete len:267 (-) Transcript_72069:15-815(-)
MLGLELCDPLLQLPPLVLRIRALLEALRVEHVVVDVLALRGLLDLQELGLRRLQLLPHAVKPALHIVLRGLVGRERFHDVLGDLLDAGWPLGRCVFRWRLRAALQRQGRCLDGIELREEVLEVGRQPEHEVRGLARIGPRRRVACRGSEQGRGDQAVAELPLVAKPDGHGQRERRPIPLREGCYDAADGGAERLPLLLGERLLGIQRQLQRQEHELLARGALLLAERRRQCGWQRRRGLRSDGIARRSHVHWQCHLRGEAGSSPRW